MFCLNIRFDQPSVGEALRLIEVLQVSHKPVHSGVLLDVDTSYCTANGTSELVITLKPTETLLRLCSAPLAR